MTKSLSHRVYDRMLREILDRRLRPGDELNRRNIAARIGVSTAPVREALQQLEYDGYLVTRPRHGTMVRTITIDDVRDRLILREAIEAQAARLYCGETIRRNSARLRKLAQKVNSPPHDSIAAWRAEIDFHLKLTELAQSPLLSATLKQVMQHSLFHAVNKMLPFHPRPLEGSHVDCHLALIEALQTDDPTEAQRFIHEHVSARLKLLDQMYGAEGSAVSDLKSNP